jgi:hypothetical protein
MKDTFIQGIYRRLGQSWSRHPSGIPSIHLKMERLHLLQQVLLTRRLNVTVVGQKLLGDRNVSGFLVGKLQKRYCEARNMYRRG